ncbi:MAG: hypothetical protein ACM30G_23220 [Micromonosporaceae bacterium]
MRLLRRKRATPYSELPEFQTGLVVLTRGGSWHILNANAGIAPDPRPARADLAGPALAAGFGESWARAKAGAKRVRGLDEWIRALHPDTPEGDDDGLAAAWQEFFLGGGVAFSVRTRPEEGIIAVRCCWVWPAAGRERVHAGTRPADRLAVTPTDDWQPLTLDAASWREAPMWTDAAAWLRARATDDSRCAIWWAAGADGAPDAPIADWSEAAESLRAWWSGAAGPAAATTELARYGVPPAGLAWLRWDPAGSPRADGLGAVLGFGRDAGGVRLYWGDPATGSAPPRRWQAEPVDPDRAEQVAAEALATGGQPTTVEWQPVSS